MEAKMSTSSGLHTAIQGLNISTLALLLVSIYLITTLFTSLYSAFLGPLSKFPGPKLRAFSRFPRLISQFQGTELKDYTALHLKYGPVVRIGPSELSYAGGAEAFKEIYGFRKAVYKDPFFYIKPFNQTDALITADDATHSRQRKLVSHAFADKSLKELEPMLKEWCGKLVDKLTQKAGADDDIDMLKMLNCTTFDIMGDLSFNEGLNMLEDGEYSPWVKTIFGSIKEAVKLRAIRMTSTFVDTVVKKFLMNNPKVRVKMIEHWKYTTERVNRRLAKTPGRPDLWSKILEKGDGPGGLSLGEHHSMGSLFMIAGTETTATALSGVTYYLTRNPDAMKKLTDEIRSSHTSYEDMTLESVARLKYLMAVLQEGLRMYPPVPSHLFRRTPKGGAELCGQWVPDDTSVAVHHYATYRNPELWNKPNEFHPERWLGDPEFNNDHLDALEPFSVGPRNCLGKNLAWHEMRLILSTVLLHFDVELLEESMDWPDQKVYTLWEKKPLICKLKAVSQSS